MVVGVLAWAHGICMFAPDRVGKSEARARAEKVEARDAGDQGSPYVGQSKDAAVW